jgi:hypothetical protein
MQAKIAELDTLRMQRAEYERSSLWITSFCSLEKHLDLELQLHQSIQRE